MLINFIMSIKTYNDDCFNIFPKLEDNSIDCVICDLPFNQTSCHWDCAIDLENMWKELKRICKKKANYVFFCTTKFGYTLIKSNEKWFRYDLCWAKSRKVGFLSANKMPLRRHEMVYIFGDDEEDKRGLNNELMEYAKKIFKHINKTKTQIKKEIGDMSHFFTGKNVKQFRLPTELKYNRMIKKYNIDKLEYFITYEKLKKMMAKPKSTYNPQKKEGKPYKSNKKNFTKIYGQQKEIKTINKGDRHPDSVLKYEPEHEMVYIFGKKGESHKTYNPQKTKGKAYKWKSKRTNHELYGNVGDTPIDNKGDRHPDSVLKYELSNNPIGEEAIRKGIKRVIYKDNGTRHPDSVLKIPSVLEYKNPSKSVHRTQKPVKLLEFLVKSYTNEGDTIIDFTAGSGTTGLACLKNNRKCILIEKDPKIFKIMEKRINDFNNMSEKDKDKLN